MTAFPNSEFFEKFRDFNNFIYLFLAVMDLHC